MTIHGAIFDVDGTLLDSMSVWDTIGEDYLCSIGYEPEEGLNEVLKAMSLHQAAGYFRSRYGVPLGIREIVDGIDAMLEHYYRCEVPLKPGAASVLNAFGRAGIPMCIATATDRCLVEAALSRLGVLSCFRGILTCGEVGHGKDEPHIFEAALQFLGTARRETFVFDDALYAVRTAKKAGFPVVAVHDIHEKEQERLHALADLYWDGFPEVKSLKDIFKNAEILI